MTPPPVPVLVLDGAVVQLAAAVVLFALWEQGLEVTAPSPTVLSVEPTSKIASADHARIRAHTHDLLALIHLNLNAH
jgi:hypothetical protein